MPSEPDWLKYTGFTSMRELALEAMRNDSTLRAARLSQAEKGIQRMRATARLDLAKRVKTRPNYAEPSEDDDDDQCEEEEGDKTDADFVVEDGSNEAMPDADYVPGAESEGGSPKSTSRSEDPEESEDENTHVLQEATQPGLARDIPLPREALPQLQPPVIESLHAALRLEPSAELLPTALPQLPAFWEPLHTRLQSEPPLAEPSSRALPTTEPLDPQSSSENRPPNPIGRATVNPHFSSHVLSNDPTSLSVSSATSLDDFSGFTNAMSAGGRLRRLLDLEQRSHQLPITSEQQRNDKQTNHIRDVDDTQNPARKRARLRDHNVGLIDSERRSCQVQAALGQQKNDKQDKPAHSISPIQLAITNIRTVATHIEKLLEERGDSMGGMEEEYDKLDDVHAYLMKLHRDIWRQQG